MTSFDPTAILETYKNAFAPMLRAQQEALKTFESFARHQYTVAGDYLNLSIAQAKAAVDAPSSKEFFSRQAELVGQFGEQLRARSEEFVKLSTQAQGTFKQFVVESTANVAETAPRKKAA